MSTKGNGKTIQWLRDHVGYNADYCLVWPFFRNINGYGQMGYLGESHYAHRMMCTLAHGEPPTPQHEAAHSCGNGHGGCCNPTHLSWKTISENLRDCAAHGTQARSYHGSKGRLTAEQVEGIRALRGKKTQDEIADIFGVSAPTVRDIFLGRTHTRPSKIKHWTEEEDNKIREAVKLGYSFPRMAEHVGRPLSGVMGRTYRLGLTSGRAPTRADYSSIRRS